MKPEPIAIHHHGDRQEQEGGTEGEEKSPGKMFLCPPSLSTLSHGEIGLLQALLVSITERMEGYESGSRSGGMGKGKLFPAGRGLCLGDFPWDFYHHITSYLHGITQDGGKAPGAAGGFGLSAETAVPSRWKGRSLLWCAGAKLSGSRLASSASFYAQAAEPEFRNSPGHAVAKRCLYTTEVEHQQRWMWAF